MKTSTGSDRQNAKPPKLRRAAAGPAAPHAAGLVMLGLTVLPGAASALDTHWIGGAPDAVWDAAANWSDGAPMSLMTEARLGSFDTTVRHGIFTMAAVHGTGPTRMTGGELRLGSRASNLGHLHLHGGAIALSTAPLTLQNLTWSGGIFGGDEPGDREGPRVTVLGTTRLTASGQVTARIGPAGLHLMGETVWEDSGPTLEVAGLLRLGPGGRFLDHAATGDHELQAAFGSIVNEGHYEKTGAGKTRITSPSEQGHFHNLGTFTVRQGTLAVDGMRNAWNNLGTFRVAGGNVSVDTPRDGTIHNSGTIDVQSGALRLTRSRAGLDSTGQWQVGPGGRVLIEDAAPEFDPFTAHFTAGEFYNEGTVQFGAGLAAFAGARLWGPGRVEVINGGHLSVEGDLTLGGLEIGHTRMIDGGPITSSVSVSGRVTLNGLEWAEGSFNTQGPVIVNGAAALSQGAQHGPSFEDYFKAVESDFHFNGHTVWAGDADVRGEGRLHIGPDGVFEDRNATGVPVPFPQGQFRPTHVGVASVVNLGTYLKNGKGATVIDSAFDNAGTIRSVDAGELTFAGALDNRGTLEAVGSRLQVSGPLAQWHQTERRLAGGRYIARHGVIVLELGARQDDTASPAGIEVNSAEVVLEGQSAALQTRWGDEDVNALGGLRDNQGRLVLLSGARLALQGGLHNSGSLEIGAGSSLQLAGDYLQDDSVAASWIGGHLEASDFKWHGGSFSAGLADAVGRAQLTGGDVSFASPLFEVLFEVDIASREQFDVVEAGGAVQLGGILVVDFQPGTPTPGVYRILTADGGVAGRFSQLRTDLNPSLYSVLTVVGDTYVDLHVAAVPEPETLALLAAGLFSLRVAVARRRRYTAGPSRSIGS